MMTLCSLAIAAALLGQLTDSRYPTPATPAEPTLADPVAAESSAPATSVTVVPETPQPTLDDSYRQHAAESPTSSVERPSIEVRPIRDAIGKEASASESADRETTDASGAKPSELIRVLTQPGPNQVLGGSPLTLAEALSTAKTRREQTERAAAYWTLTAAAADYYLALREGTELATLRQAVLTPSAEWDARQKEATARTAVARAAAIAAQHELQLLLGGPAGLPLPVPADVPHCGRYETRYDMIFGRQGQPSAEQLAQLLTLRYDQLRRESKGVAEALDWLARVSESRNPQSDGVELLRVHELLSSRRREFLGTARQYNQDIAVYTELAAPGDVPAPRLAAMLIHTKESPADSLRQDSQVTQATALEPTSTTAQDPQTDEKGAEAAAEDSGRMQIFGGRRESRRPLLPRLLDRQREHSIVLRRHRLNPN